MNGYGDGDGGGERGGMTVKEAGRLGGKKLVATRGVEHMSEIDRRGGQRSPTKFEAGTQRIREISSKGGKASGGNFARDVERAKAAGRLGGLTKKAKSQ